MIKSSVSADCSVHLNFDANSLPALLLLPGAPLTAYAVTQGGVMLLDAAKQATLLNTLPSEVIRSLGLFQSNIGESES
ncbi:MAG: hypothetical protein WCT35_04810 [Sideroxydans sp.]